MTTKKKAKTTLPFPGAVLDTSRMNDTGNVFGWIGGVTRALQRAGATVEQIEEFKAEVTSGDYNHAIRTCYKWVDVQ